MSTESVRLRQINLNLPDPLQFSRSILVVCFAEPVIVIISILNIRGEKVFQQQLQLSINHCDVGLDFRLNKGDVIRSECQQGGASYTFSCKIFTHVKKETAAPPDRTWQSFRRLIWCNQLPQWIIYWFLWIIQQHAVQWRHFKRPRTGIPRLQSHFGCQKRIFCCHVLNIRWETIN